MYTYPGPGKPSEDDLAGDINELFETQRPFLAVPIYHSFGGYSVSSDSMLYICKLL